MSVPTPGDFSFLGDAFSRTFLEDAYQAVTAAGAWEFMKTRSPPEDRGYMFWSEPPELKEIQKHMKLGDQHSGASYGMVMRSMQAIAVRGWDNWVAQQQEYLQEERVKRLQVEKLRSGASTQR